MRSIERRSKYLLQQDDERRRSVINNVNDTKEESEIREQSWLIRKEFIRNIKFAFYFLIPIYVLLLLANYLIIVFKYIRPSGVKVSSRILALTIIVVFLLSLPCFLILVGSRVVDAISTLARRIRDRFTVIPGRGYYSPLHTTLTGDIDCNGKMINEDGTWLFKTTKFAERGGRSCDNRQFPVEYR